MFQVVLLGLCCIHTTCATPRFLSISDIHYGSQNTSVDGKDIGNQFFAITMNKFKELGNQVDFILVLGDLPTHLLGYVPEKEVYEKTVFHGLFAAATHLKPMFYVSGNNDSLSGNYQAFEFSGKSPLNFATDWSGACVSCDGLIIDDTHMRSGAYYTSYVMPENRDVILVVLNTTQWMKMPLFLPKYLNQERDASIQLHWFNEQLKTHHAKQLLIAMHEPPGKSFFGNQFWQQSYLQQFTSILAQNQHLYGEITLLTSHTHMDEFRKIHLPSGKNIYAYSTPSVSRIHHNNSAMKLFSLDAQMRVKNFITYYTSSFNEWGAEQYDAQGSPSSIFSQCNNETLAQCLNALSDKQVCDSVEKGLFYGVKSTRVDNTACRTIYPVS